MPITDLPECRCWDTEDEDDDDVIAFLRAFDAWATSPDHCGGELFDAMLRARKAVGSFDDEEPDPEASKWLKPRSSSLA